MAKVIIDCEDRFADVVKMASAKSIFEAKREENKAVAEVILKNAFNAIDALGIKVCLKGGKYYPTNSTVEVSDFNFK